ncbi:hypothetical protein LA76x_0454 [Lysobacter antibioticus]|uniref:Uncharacterized protein n=1 Tax=Lysobacter antibioticus TaxID=84531 RepID=A0A0S2F4Y6_LYSAN|nr:hypothetical protein LA76x_0454 [Lysobacter antibioticus]
MAMEADGKLVTTATHHRLCVYLLPGRLPLLQYPHLSLIRLLLLLRIDSIGETLVQAYLA